MTAIGSEKRKKVKYIISAPIEEVENQEVLVSGWVKSIRVSKKFSFMMLNDGSCQKDLQIIIDASLDNYSDVTKMITGFCVSVDGLLVASKGKGQSVEMQAKKIRVLGSTDSSYPLQKKNTSMEFLREVAHLRARTNTFGAIYRVRHALSFATHKFFNEKDFYYINTPIITASDCEGAGEMFSVTPLDMGNIPRNENNKIDFTTDFFSKAAFLTVSGQLNAECLALGLGAVYTFGPTFRAENSNTPRHLSEFWMIEPEMAFFDLDATASLATEYLKYLFGYILENCSEELSFLEKRSGKVLKDQLKAVIDSPFEKITYTDAISILEKAPENKKFEFPVFWGCDLQTEHERFLTEKYFKRPVIVTDYPKEIKAFYMKQNEDQKTVRAMDVLVPGVGEIIGGSQREEDYNKLLARISEMKLEEKDYWWYLQLRKFGSAPHSGFGLGLERACMYVTGTENIRDVIPFPRTPRNADF